VPTCAEHTTRSDLLSCQSVPVTVDVSDATDMPTLSDLLSCQSVPVTVDVSDAADMPTYACHSWCKQR